MMFQPGDRLKLAGFLNPGLGPNFLVPVFGSGGSSHYIQKAREPHTVDGFALLAPETSEQIRRFSYIAYKGGADFKWVDVGIGDEPLFAFRIDNDTAWVGRKEALGRELSCWMNKTYLGPMLYLEILEFINGAPQQIAEAIDWGQQYLAEQKVPQARTWGMHQQALLRHKPGYPGHLQLPREPRSDFFNSLPAPEALFPLLPLLHLADARDLQVFVKTKKLFTRTGLEKHPSPYPLPTTYGRLGRSFTTGCAERYGGLVLFVLDSQLLGLASYAYPFVAPHQFTYPPTPPSFFLDEAPSSFLLDEMRRWEASWYRWYPPTHYFNRLLRIFDSPNPRRPIEPGDFQIPPTRLGISSYINRYFGDLVSYVSSQPAELKGSSAWDPAILEINLIEGPPIMVYFRKPEVINNPNLIKQIFIPADLPEEPDLSALSAPVVTYPPTIDLTELLLNYYRSNGYLIDKGGKEWRH